MVPLAAFRGPQSTETRLKVEADDTVWPGNRDSHGKDALYVLDEMKELG